jgi:hypothetical protein
MNFEITLDNTDFDTPPVEAFYEYNTADFTVEAEFLPADPSVGVQEDWDIDVFFEGKRVTWDLKSSVLASLSDKCYEYVAAQDAEKLIDIHF